MEADKIVVLENGRLMEDNMSTFLFSFKSVQMVSKSGITPSEGGRHPICKGLFPLEKGVFALP